MKEFTFKCNLVKDLVKRANEIHHDTYRVVIDKEKEWLTIENEHRFSGCLLEDIASLCSVYNWTFGVHVKIGTDTLYCLL